MRAALGRADLVSPGVPDGLLLLFGFPVVIFLGLVILLLGRTFVLVVFAVITVFSSRSTRGGATGRRVRGFLRLVCALGLLARVARPLASASGSSGAGVSSLIGL